MLTLNDLQRQVKNCRSVGLPLENYWVYIANDGTDIFAVPNELKMSGYTGYFVEDDSKLKNIHTVAVRKLGR